VIQWAMASQGRVVPPKWLRDEQEESPGAPEVRDVDPFAGECRGNHPLLAARSAAVFGSINDAAKTLAVQFVLLLGCRLRSFTRKRVHVAYLWCTGAFFLFVFGAIFGGTTRPWLAIAHWITGV